jgi:hypothetical protein
VKRGAWPDEIGLDGGPARQYNAQPRLALAEFPYAPQQLVNLQRMPRRKQGGLDVVDPQDKVGACPDESLESPKRCCGRVASGWPIAARLVEPLNTE